MARRRNPATYRQRRSRTRAWSPAQRRRRQGAKRRAGAPKAPDKQVVVDPGQEEILAGTPTPFNTGEEIIEQARQSGDWTQELGALGAQILEAQAQRDLGHRSLELERGSSTRAATDATGSRGLLRSSIQQHALSDITADIQQRKSALDSQLSAAQSRFAARAAEIDQERRQQQIGYDVSAVENAAAVSPKQTHLQKKRAPRYGPAPKQQQVAAGAKQRTTLGHRVTKKPVAPKPWGRVGRPGAPRQRPRAHVPTAPGVKRPRERGARSRNPGGRH